MDDHEYLEDKESAAMKNTSTSPAMVVRKHGGWKTMPFIIGNETFANLAGSGLLANFMVYLTTQFNMEHVYAATLLNIFAGASNITPLIGAIISDSYLGRYRTLAYSSIASLMGMILLTLTSIVTDLRPAHCTSPTTTNCIGPSTLQLSVLVLSLLLLSIGGGGIKPCTIPFGVDQFDASTEKGRRGINSFFNWYYFTFTIAMLISVTIVVYIQDNISWSLGLGIPTLLMVLSIFLFFVGTNRYVFVQPEGSVLTGILKVFVAAYKRRHMRIIGEDHEVVVYYDPPLVSKLPLTNELSSLNKAAMLTRQEAISMQQIDSWSLCSVQQVKEVKSLIKVIPIWASGIISFMGVLQQGTYAVIQAMVMDRHIGTTGFEIPPGSLGTFGMLALVLWIPFYDRLVIPAARRITRQEQGITLLQRIGIGLVLYLLSMVTAGLVEVKRRQMALTDPLKPMSVLWMVPQFFFNGLAEAFNLIGQMEFYYKEFPDNMKSVANSVFFFGVALSSYLSGFMINLVHNVSGTNGGPNWLAEDINKGRLEYFYYCIAVVGGINFIYFLVVSRRYRYKGSKYTVIGESEMLGTSHEDVSVSGGGGHVMVEMKPMEGKLGK